MPSIKTGKRHSAETEWKIPITAIRLLARGDQKTDHHWCFLSLEIFSENKQTKTNKQKIMTHCRNPGSIHAFACEKGGGIIRITKAFSKKITHISIFSGDLCF